MIRFVPLLVAAALAACASAPEPAAPAADASSGTQVTDAAPTTGSRLARQTTDRTVKRIGNQSYKQDDAPNIKGQANELGAKSN